MSIVLVGSTSGSVTLQEPAVAGTTVLDLPAVSGTILTTGSSGQSIPKAALPTGSVLQVVQGSLGSQFTTTSTSFVTSGLAASITPTSATSKILILVSCSNAVINGSANHTWITVYRGATNLAPTGSTLALFGMYSNSGGNTQCNANISHLDSPATTSSTTYTVYVATGGSQGGFNWNNQTSYIQLLEIAA
jgi:hypothetical protein